METVLALDAALLHTGYCIHDGLDFTDFGVMTVDRNLPLDKRLYEIGKWLSDIIKKHKIDTIALEGCYMARNAQTTYRLSLVHGTIMFVASCYGVRVNIIPPSAVKRAVAGKGNAAKEEVAAAINSIYPGIEHRGAHADDLSDALAIYHTYAAGNTDTGEHGKKQKKGSKKLATKSRKCPL